jgi:hypothetical protein
MELKLCYVAALAAFGWYLMAPLPDNPGASISLWTQYDSFDSADQCRQAGYRLQKENEAGGDPSKSKLAGVWECVASDDPRLKPSPGDDQEDRGGSMAPLASPMSDQHRPGES